MKEQLVGASWETSSLLSHMKHPLTGEDVLSISFSLRVLWTSRSALGWVGGGESKYL